MTKTLMTALLKWVTDRFVGFLMFIVLLTIYHLTFHSQQTPTAEIPMMVSDEHPSLPVETGDGIMTNVCVHLEEFVSPENRISMDIAIPFIAKLEGLRLKVYNDVGTSAIGYGHHLTNKNMH